MKFLIIYLILTVPNLMASTLFSQHCSGCHGGARSLNGRGLSTAYIKKVLLRGKPGTSMQSWRGKLTPSQINHLTQYVKDMQ